MKAVRKNDKQRDFEYDNEIAEFRKMSKTKRKERQKNRESKRNWE